MFDNIKNATIYRNKYRTHNEAVIVACYFNPQNSPYRLKAFNRWYESIKHLNHSIVECVIGDTIPQLPQTPNIKRVYTKSLLWHKETLLGYIIGNLPEKYKYVFWLDTDIIFSNLNWLTEGVEQLKTYNILQPFEYCVHLKKDEESPSFPMDNLRTQMPNLLNNKVWRSFCANYHSNSLWRSNDYNTHGHVGFAWGARREVFKVPLYEKALIGGADHIIAHAAAGQIPHECICKSFTENLDEVNQWSKAFYGVIEGKIGFVKGDLYHLWHGDIEKRQYLKRIKDFTPIGNTIVDRDPNGLFVTQDDKYVWDYFAQREVPSVYPDVTLETKNENTPEMPQSEQPEQLEQFDGFKGGDFGGGGASGQWDTENFS